MSKNGEGRKKLSDEGVEEQRNSGSWSVRSSEGRGWKTDADTVAYGRIRDAGKIGSQSVLKSSRFQHLPGRTAPRMTSRNAIAHCFLVADLDCMGLTGSTSHWRSHCNALRASVCANPFSSPSIIENSPRVRVTMEISGNGVSGRTHLQLPGPLRVLSSPQIKAPNHSSSPQALLTSTPCPSSHLPPSLRLLPLQVPHGLDHREAYQAINSTAASAAELTLACSRIDNIRSFSLLSRRSSLHFWRVSGLAASPSSSPPHHLGLPAPVPALPVPPFLVPASPTRPKWSAFDRLHRLSTFGNPQLLPPTLYLATPYALFSRSPLLSERAPSSLNVDTTASHLCQPVVGISYFIPSLHGSLFSSTSQQPIPRAA